MNAIDVMVSYQLINWTLIWYPWFEALTEAKGEAHGK